MTKRLSLPRQSSKKGNDSLKHLNVYNTISLKVSHKGTEITEDTKKDTKFVNLSLFLCVLCELRVSVRDKENKFFTITGY